MLERAAEHFLSRFMGIGVWDNKKHCTADNLSFSLAACVFALKLNKYIYIKEGGKTMGTSLEMNDNSVHRRQIEDKNLVLFSYFNSKGKHGSFSQNLSLFAAFDDALAEHQRLK